MKTFFCALRTLVFIAALAAQVFGHATFHFAEWDKSTGECSREYGNFAEDYLHLMHLKAWLGLDTIGRGMELIRWATNSDKWVMYTCGHEGHASAVTKTGCNQIILNWIDFQSIRTSTNAPNTSGDLSLSFCNTAGDLWIKPPKDEYIGTHYEDISGTWLPIGTWSTTPVKNVRNSWDLSSGKPVMKFEKALDVNGIAVSVAFTRARQTNYNGWRGDIVRFDIENGKAVSCDTIYRGIAHCPSISPDGKQVAFFRDGDTWTAETGRIAGGDDFLSIMNIDGKNVRDLVTFSGDFATNTSFRNGEDRLMDWPVGGWIYYNYPHSSRVIWRVNVDDPTKNEKYYNYGGDGLIRRWNLSLDGTCAAGDGIDRGRAHEFPPGKVAEQCAAGCNAALSCSGRFTSAWGWSPSTEEQVLVDKYHSTYEYVPAGTGISLGKTASTRIARAYRDSNRNLCIDLPSGMLAKAALYDLSGRRVLSMNAHNGALRVPAKNLQSLFILRVEDIRGELIILEKLF